MGTNEETVEKSWQEEVEDIFNSLDVSINWDTSDGHLNAECEFYSDAGEDCCFYLTADSLVEFRQSLTSEYEMFNPEEHAIEWYGANQGEPSSLRTLLDDAEGIDRKLKDLCCALRC